MSREQLAVAAGISSRTVEYIEAGRDARVSTIVAIARVLDVSIGELFGEAA